MTTKHTPTPWRHKQLAPAKDAFGGGYYELMGGPYRIGEVSNLNGYEQNAANAAFIVRAVNHHDGLVASVRELLEVLDSMGGPLHGVVARHARARLADLEADNA